MSGDFQNSGIISANSRKREGRKDPDISGSLDSVTCPCCHKSSSYWLSGWLKEGRKGKFYSLSVRPKDAPGATPQNDEDIPWE